MNLRQIGSRLLIILFFILIGYCLASSIAVKSIMGIILAIISLGAGIVFLWLLPKLTQPAEDEETVEA